MLSSRALNFWAILFLSLITGIYFYVQNKLKFWEKRKVPFDKHHWFFGSFGDFENGRISLGPDVELPEGTGCVVPIYALHHDPEFYPDPKKFDPQRFSDRARRERSLFTFIPFGGGPRICIGLRFAEQQTRLARFELVEGFEVSLCRKSQNPLQLNPKARFLLPKGGIWLRLSSHVTDN